MLHAKNFGILKDQKEPPGAEELRPRYVRKFFSSERNRGEKLFVGPDGSEMALRASHRCNALHSWSVAEYTI